MKLSVLERLILLNLLPVEGSFTNLKLLRIARENLSFNEEENKALAFRQEGSQMVWNDFATFNKSTGELLEGTPALVERAMNKNPESFERRTVVGEKEVEIGEVVTKMVVEELKKLNREEKLKNEHMSLYEKFIG
jgi:hypothetical protein